MPEKLAGGAATPDRREVEVDLGMEEEKGPEVEPPNPLEYPPKLVEPTFALEEEDLADKVAPPVRLTSPV